MTRLRLLVAGSTLGLAVLALLAGTHSTSRSASAPQAPTSQTSRPGVAVVELFTSEGCSSCPPADRLLRTLVENARAQGRPVYGLSFHVDYWNRLGWTDPYSDAAYSRRQRRYSQTLEVDPYTPQVVVNGRRAMVGSRSKEVRERIESALSEPAPVGVRLRVDTAGRSVTVTHRLDGPLPDDAELQLAVVERGLAQDVTTGENAGRTLRHANVVRAFTARPAVSDGPTHLTLPDAIDLSEASVIGYVQGPSLAVLGADRVDLKQRSPSTAEPGDG